MEQWKKSSFSHGKGDCVEVANMPHTVKIRDTRHRNLGHVTVPVDEWAALISALKNGEEL